ncbi:peptidoglycan DD-metalloendopeptidase family protein [bacterium]|nr:peptidoglycan DD-metalloendopeptidase family protein [bacterium]
MSTCSFSPAQIVSRPNSFFHSPFGRFQLCHLLCSEGFAVLPYSFILRASHLTQFELVKYAGYRRNGERRSHKGIDIFAPVGTPLIAPRDGVVGRIGKGPNAGKLVWVIDEHGEYGYQYLHCLEIAEGLSVGQPVRKGQTIAYLGQTGNAGNTPPHLHFGVAKLFRHNSLHGGKRYVDPLPFLQPAEASGPLRVWETMRTLLFLATHRHGRPMLVLGRLSTLLFPTPTGASR